MEHVRRHLGVSERRACRILGQSRSTQRHKPKERTDEADLTRRIVELASEYGRYGYRRITAMLWREGWRVNHKRVARVWSYDFVFDRTHDGKAFRMLTIVDEWTRECLRIDVERRLLQTRHFPGGGEVRSLRLHEIDAGGRMARSFDPNPADTSVRDRDLTGHGRVW